VCPSEVSDAEHALWQRYKDEGVQVWAIASAEDSDVVRDFRDALGLSYPVLDDQFGLADRAYRELAGQDDSQYPFDWVIDGDGRVAYQADAYDPAEIQGVLEGLLGR